LPCLPISCAWSGVPSGTDICYPLLRRCRRLSLSSLALPPDSRQNRRGGERRRLLRPLGTPISRRRGRTRRHRPLRKSDVPLIPPQESLITQGLDSLVNGRDRPKTKDAPKFSIRGHPAMLFEEGQDLAHGLALLLRKRSRVRNCHVRLPPAVCSSSCHASPHHTWPHLTLPSLAGPCPIFIENGSTGLERLSRSSWERLCRETIVRYYCFDAAVSLGYHASERSRSLLPPAQKVS